MYPVLVEIGGLKVYAYGVFVALGILAGVRVADREALRRGLDRDAFFDMAFWSVIAGIVGARAFHVAVYRGDYANDPLEILRIWNGGLVFYGGLLLAIPVGILFLRRRGVPVLPIVDAAAVGIPLGLAFGRVGCFLAGCCYGKVCWLPWAVIFRAPGSLAPQHIPLHPTQLYEALASVAIFGILYGTRKRFETPGMLFWTLLLLYGTARSLLEFFRNDPRGFVGPFSESQVVSAVLILYALASIARSRVARPA